MTAYHLEQAHKIKAGKILTDILMRLFIATFFSESIIDWLVRSELVLSELFPARSLRLTKAENLHLTFQFIGEVPGSKVSQISQILCEILADEKAFQFQPGALGVFPNRYRPRTLWIGLEPDEKFYKIASKINKALENSVRTDKKRFLPHITLARFNDEHTALGSVEPTNIALPLFRIPDHDRIISTVTLCNSELTKHGPIYSVLSSYQLNNYVKL